LSNYLRDVVRRQQVFVQLEEVVHMLVQPEEGRIASRSLEVLHDARRNAVALKRVRHFGQHHVTVVVQLAVVRRVDTVRRGLYDLAQQVDAGRAIEAEEPRVGLQETTSTSVMWEES
jgi:hypothetical protein